MSYPSEGSPMDPEDHPSTTTPKMRMAQGSDQQIPVLQPQAPIAPLSPFEQYNVSAGQGKQMPPMKWNDKKK